MQVSGFDGANTLLASLSLLRKRFKKNLKTKTELCIHCSMTKGAH